MRNYHPEQDQIPHGVVLTTLADFHLTSAHFRYIVLGKMEKGNG